MANVDFPFGFQPLRKRDGGSLVCEYLPIADANSEIGKNDPIARGTDGYIGPATATSQTIVGVAAEHKAANSGGSIAYYPAENLLMIAQVDDATVNAQTDFDLEYALTTGTPNALTGLSTYEIDGSSQALTATLPIKITQVHQVINQLGNELGDHVVVECVFNEACFKGAGTTG